MRQIPLQGCGSAFIRRVRNTYKPESLPYVQMRLCIEFRPSVGEEIVMGVHALGTGESRVEIDRTPSLTYYRKAEEVFARRGQSYALAGKG
jgi:hypothetical protein